MDGEDVDQSLWERIPVFVRAVTGFILAVVALLAVLIPTGVFDDCDGGGNGTSPTDTPVITTSPLDPSASLVLYYEELEEVLDEFWFPMENLGNELVAGRDLAGSEAEKDAVFQKLLPRITGEAVAFAAKTTSLAAPTFVATRHEGLVAAAERMVDALSEIGSKQPAMRDYGAFIRSLYGTLGDLKVECGLLQSLADDRNVSVSLKCQRS